MTIIILRILYALFLWRLLSKWLHIADLVVSPGSVHPHVLSIWQCCDSSHHWLFHYPYKQNILIILFSMSIMELLQAKYLQVLFQQNIPTKSSQKM
jgi:hypothetical protein